MDWFRAVFPREHGAYAQLAFPLVAGIALGGPAPGALAFVAAAIAFFLLYEPMAILTGVRGQRLATELARHALVARRWLAMSGTLIGVLAVTVSPAPARWAALAPAGLGAMLVPAVLRGRLKSPPGEVLLVAALSSLTLPVALAGGSGWPRATTAAVVWFVSFLLAVVTVHAIKAASKEGSRRRWAPGAAFVLAIGVVVIAGAGVAAGMVSQRGALALVPPVVVAGAVSAMRVHPRRLKRVGWSLVSANAVSLIILIA